VKKALALVFGIMMAVSGLWAQQLPASDAPASKEDIEKLLVALHVHERLQLIMENSRKQTKTMMAEILHKEMPEATQGELSQVQGMVDEMIDGIEKDYPTDAVLQDMVPVYQRHLTKSDSDALIAFYSSPVGQKVLRELPAITSEAMQVSIAHLQPRMEAAIGKLKERIEQMVEEDRNKKKPTSK
jgi:hypothetical protein